MILFIAFLMISSYILGVCSFWVWKLLKEDHEWQVRRLQEEIELDKKQKEKIHPPVIKKDIPKPSLSVSSNNLKNLKNSIKKGK